MQLLAIRPQLVSAVAGVILATSSTLCPLPANSLPFVTQYETAADIPQERFQSNDVIRGKVVRVIDGDTVRIRHLPLAPFSRAGENYQGKLSEHTISVRTYGVDCPETAKFGNPAMPFAKEATEWTDRLIGNKVVEVQLLSRDQYNRVVGSIRVRGKFLPWTKTDLTVSLAERGLATLYTGRGAQYNNNRNMLESKIATAKRQGRGIWSNDGAETPAEYKRRIKANAKTRTAKSRTTAVVIDDDTNDL